MIDEGEDCIPQVGRVLIVENHPTHAQPIARRILRHSGLETDIVESGEQALELLDAHVLVIADISLPGMSGIDVAKRVALERPDLPVVLVSAHDELLALALGADLNLAGAFAKPLRTEHLERIEGIAEHVARRSLAPPQPQWLFSQAVARDFLEGVRMATVDADGIEDILLADSKEYLQSDDLTEMVDSTRSLIEARFKRLLTTLGNRAKLEGVSAVRLSKSPLRFSTQMARHILMRLPIDPYVAPEFLDLMHLELAARLSTEPLRGSWGLLSVDSEGLLLSGGQSAVIS